MRSPVPLWGHPAIWRYRRSKIIRNHALNDELRGEPACGPERSGPLVAVPIRIAGLEPLRQSEAPLPSSLSGHSTHVLRGGVDPFGLADPHTCTQAKRSWRRLVTKLAIVDRLRATSSSSSSGAASRGCERRSADMPPQVGDAFSTSAVVEHPNRGRRFRTTSWGARIEGETRLLRTSEATTQASDANAT